MRKWWKIGMIMGLVCGFALPVPLAKAVGPPSDAGVWLPGFLWEELDEEGNLLGYWCFCPDNAKSCYCVIPVPLQGSPQSHPAYLYEDLKYYYFRASIDETATPPVYTLDENGDGKMAIAKDAFE